MWDRQWVAWTGQGCPNDDPAHPVPGPHPEKNHLWNIDPKAHCKEKGVNWVQPGEKEAEEEVDDY